MLTTFGQHRSGSTQTWPCVGQHRPNVAAGVRSLLHSCSLELLRAVLVQIRSFCPAARPEESNSESIIACLSGHPLRTGEALVQHLRVFFDIVGVVVCSVAAQIRQGM